MPEGWFGGYDLSRMNAQVHPSMQPNIQSRITSMVQGVGGHYVPHHPINCPDPESMSITGEKFWCAHNEVPFLDERTQVSMRISICALIMEMADKL